MNVVHVVHGIREQASGTSVSVPLLCRYLTEIGVNLQLHVCEGRNYFNAPYEFYCHGYRNWPPRLGLSPAMKKALKKQALDANIFHVHGLWNAAHIYPEKATRGTDCNLVISPRGTLGAYPLSLSRWKKRALWYLWQRRVLEEAACIHATSEAEYKEVRDKGITSPVAVIPNGIDIPQVPNNNFKNSARIRRLVFLSRITPKKGLDNLLHAWVYVQDRFPDWQLDVTGIDDRGYEGRMKALAKNLELKRVVFTGPVYGKHKRQTLLGADLFVLPTHSENFGLAVAEALAHSIPVITTKGTPWRGLEQYQCGWWIDIGVDPLVETLKVALAESPEKLHVRGTRGREWMKRDFSWATVSKKMLKTYQWLTGSGGKPEYIYKD